MALPRKILEEKLRRFLEEDIGQGDLTTTCMVPSGVGVKAQIIVNDEGVMAGLEEAQVLLNSLGLQAKPLVKDGSKVKAGTIVMEVNGDARTILMAERTLLNIMSRMSGIATETSKLVEKVRSAGYIMKVACTRKTAPGLLYFDKKAVMIGGGNTHRLHLDDLVLIKDNHLKIVGDIVKAIKQAKQSVSFAKKIEVEVTSAEEAVKAAKTGADIVMLDNLSPRQIRNAIRKLKQQKLRSKVLIEVSGGVTEENILQYAAAGPDIISLGAITESPRTLDMNLEVVEIVLKPS